MKKLTKLIISMFIVTIIIIITIIALLVINRKQVDLKNSNPDTLAFTNIEKLNSKDLFFIINNNINTYYQYIQKQEKEKIDTIAKEGSIMKATSIGVFYSEEMYVLDKINNITVYVKGVIRDKSIENIYYLILNMDYLNNTFSIESLKKEEFENAKNNKIDERYVQDIRIQEKVYNKINEKTFTDFEILKYYFEDYKYKVLYKQEDAFNLIDARYKEEKFGNDIENYKEYIKNNKDNIQNANIVRHGITKNGQFVEYICIDNYNNYYKFNETGINKYTIILDNYTLQTDELISNYNKLTDKEKVSSNIDKIMKLINEKSYKNVYNYLNEDFRNNYFKTQGAFEEYIKTKFFDNNILGVLQIKQEGNIYIVTVPYKESLSSAAEEGTIIFYVKLGEGTNFELSFNI